MASYGTDGKINLEELNKNLKNNIPELTYQNSNKIEELPTTVTLEGHEITIDENGKVTIEEEKNTPTPPQKEKSELEKAKETGTILSATENTPITDSYGNEIIIPAGFKISEESSNNVTGGVVIEDATHTNTLGSEFVWIPVGTVYTNESKTTSETITLGGHEITIDENGKVTIEEEKNTPTPPQKEKSELEKAKETGTILSATENTPITDSYGNEIIIPAGFKISEESSNNVTGGVVIEDATHTNTLGSEFVWIPVGTVYTNESKTTSETITLGRYVFKEDGTIDTEQSKTEPGGKITISQEYGDYVTEGLKASTTRNTHAKDIETFIAKANSNHGY